MNLASQIAVIAIFAYLVGSIPFGFIVGRLRGIDIRQHGSGNIGATNIWRVLGKPWGLTTFLCDTGKGLAAVVVAKAFSAHWMSVITTSHGLTQAVPLDEGVIGITAAMGCIIGHSFPVWLGFKGGKGVATSVGVIFGVMPVASLSIFAIWGVVFKLSRYVSLASIVAASSLPVIVIFLLSMGWMRSWANFYFSVAATLLVLLRHRGNFQRLLAGTESRFAAKKDAIDSNPES